MFDKEKKFFFSSAIGAKVALTVKVKQIATAFKV